MVYGAGPTANSMIGVMIRSNCYGELRFERNTCKSGRRAPSNIVFISGYKKQDGWEVTGMD